MFRSLLGKSSSRSTTSERRRQRDRDEPPKTSSSRRKKRSSHDSTAVPSSGSKSTRGDDRGIDLDPPPSTYSSSRQYYPESETRSTVSSSYVTADPGEPIDDDRGPDDQSRSGFGDSVLSETPEESYLRTRSLRSEARRQQRRGGEERDSEVSEPLRRTEADFEREERRRRRKEKEALERMAEETEERSRQRRTTVPEATAEDSLRYSSSRAGPSLREGDIGASFSPVPPQIHDNPGPGPVFTPGLAQYPSPLPSDPAPSPATYGLAADYYNDQGQSVSTQPGVRPDAPQIIAGTQPHLMSPLAAPAPPVEPSAMGQTGAAASFYDMSPASTQPQPTTNVSQPPEKPVKPAKPETVSPSSTHFAYGIDPSLLDTHNSSHVLSQAQPTPLSQTHNANGSQQHYTTFQSHPGMGALAAGASVAAASHFAHNNTHNTQHLTQLQYQPVSLEYHRKHHGPLRRFIDFWRDPDGVAEFEEYSEIIGICKYCFEPGTTARDAPRKHNHKRRHSYEPQASRSRVDKHTRYASSDDERRRKQSNRKSWFAGSLAAYVGNSIYSRTRSTYSDVASSRSKSSTSPSSSTTSYDAKSRTSRGTTKVSDRTPPSTLKDRYTEFRRGGSDPFGLSEETFTPTKPRHSTRRRRSGSRTSSSSRGTRSSGLKDAAVAAAAIGAASSLKSRRKSRSKSPKKSRRRRYSSSSSSGSLVDISRPTHRRGLSGLSYFFTAPSEASTKAKREKSTKRRSGFFGFRSVSSSSSDDADLAFGSGFFKAPTRNFKSRQSNEEKLDAKLAGLNDTAVSLASTATRLGASRRPDLVAVKETSRPGKKSARKSKYVSDPSDNDDGWESVSESSLDSALAYGESSDSGTSRWGWRWGKRKGKEKKVGDKNQTPTRPKPTVFQPPPPSESLASLSSMHEVYPVSTPDPSRFDITTHSSSSTSFPTQSRTPIYTSQAEPIRIDQPQPIAPVSQRVYNQREPVSPQSTFSAVPARSNEVHRPPPVVPPPAEPLETYQTRRNEYDDRRSKVVGEESTHRKYDSLPAFPTKPSDNFDLKTHKRTTSQVQFDLTREQEEKELRLQRLEREKEKEKAETPRKDRVPVEYSSYNSSQPEISSRREGKQKIIEIRPKNYMEYEDGQLSDYERSAPVGVALVGASATSAIPNELDNKRSEERRERTDKREAERRSHFESDENRKSGSKGKQAAVSVTPSRRDDKRNEDRSPRRGRRGRELYYSESDEGQKTSPKGRDTDSDQSDGETAYRTRRIAKEAIKRVFSSPTHDSYVEYFTPTEVLSSKNSPRSDASDQHSAKESPKAQFDREVSQMHRDIDTNHLPWPVPRLNLIEPTPPHSHAGSVVSETVSEPPRDDHKSTVPSADHASDDISNWEVAVNPHSPVQQKQPRTVDGSVIGLGIEDQPLAEPQEESTTTSTPIEQPVYETDLGTPEVNYFEDEDWIIVEGVVVHQMHCGREVDIEFAATLAAGASLAGFDPSIVTDNPMYHICLSPEELEPEDDQDPRIIFGDVPESLDRMMTPEMTHGFVEPESLPATDTEEKTSPDPSHTWHREPGGRTNLELVGPEPLPASGTEGETLPEMRFVWTPKRDIFSRHRFVAPESLPESRTEEETSPDLRHMGHREPDGPTSYRSVEPDSSPAFDTGEETSPDLRYMGHRESDGPPTYLFVAQEFSPAFDTGEETSPGLRYMGYREPDGFTGHGFVEPESLPASEETSPDLRHMGYREPDGFTGHGFVEPESLPASDTEKETSPNLRLLGYREPDGPTRSPQRKDNDYEVDGEPSSVPIPQHPYAAKYARPDNGKPLELFDARVGHNWGVSDVQAGTNAPVHMDSPGSREGQEYSAVTEESDEAHSDDQSLPIRRLNRKPKGKKSRSSVNLDGIDTELFEARFNVLDSTKTSSDDLIIEPQPRVPTAIEEPLPAPPPRSREIGHPYRTHNQEESIAPSLDSSSTKSTSKGKRQKGKGKKGLSILEQASANLNAPETELEPATTDKVSGMENKDTDKNEGLSTFHQLIDNEADAAPEMQKRKDRMKERRSRYEEIVDSGRQATAETVFPVTEPQFEHNAVDRDHGLSNKSFLGEHPEILSQDDGASGTKRGTQNQLLAREPTTLVSSPLAEVALAQRPRSRSASPFRALNSEQRPFSRSRPPSPSPETPRLRRISVRGNPDSNPLATPSPTAIPIHFRRPLSSHGSPNIGSAPATSPTATKGHKRPKSSEFKTDRELRPLWLVELHSSAKTESPLEEQYPSLPSSRTTSRSASIEDFRAYNETEFAYDQPVLTPRRQPVPLFVDTKQGRQDEEILGSKQTTPTASTYQQGDKKDRPKYEFHSPSELLMEPFEKGLESLPPLPPFPKVTPVPEQDLPPLPESNPASPATVAESWRTASDRSSMSASSDVTAVPDYSFERQHPDDRGQILYYGSRPSTAHSAYESAVEYETGEDRTPVPGSPLSAIATPVRQPAMEAADREFIAAEPFGDDLGGAHSRANFSTAESPMEDNFEEARSEIDQEQKMTKEKSIQENDSAHPENSPLLALEELVHDVPPDEIDADTGNHQSPLPEALAPSKQGVEPGSEFTFTPVGGSIPAGPLSSLDESVHDTKRTVEATTTRLKDLIPDVLPISSSENPTPDVDSVDATEPEGLLVDPSKIEAAELDNQGKPTRIPSPEPVQTPQPDKPVVPLNDDCSGAGNMSRTQTEHKSMTQDINVDNQALPELVTELRSSLDEAEHINQQGDFVNLPAAKTKKGKKGKKKKNGSLPIVDDTFNALSDDKHSSSKGTPEFEDEVKREFSDDLGRKLEETEDYSQNPGAAPEKVTEDELTAVSRKKGKSSKGKKKSSQPTGVDDEIEDIGMPEQLVCEPDNLSSSLPETTHISETATPEFDTESLQTPCVTSETLVVPEPNKADVLETDMAQIDGSHANSQKAGYTEADAPEVEALELHIPESLQHMDIMNLTSAEPDLLSHGANQEEAPDQESQNFACLPAELLKSQQTDADTEIIEKDSSLKPSKKDKKKNKKRRGTQSLVEEPHVEEGIAEREQADSADAQAPELPKNLEVPQIDMPEIPPELTGVDECEYSSAVSKKDKKKRRKNKRSVEDVKPEVINEVEMQGTTLTISEPTQNPSFFDVEATEFEEQNVPQERIESETAEAEVSANDKVAGEHTRDISTVEPSQKSVSEVVEECNFPEQGLSLEPITPQDGEIEAQADGRLEDEQTKSSSTVGSAQECVLEAVGDTSLSGQESSQEPIIHTENPTDGETKEPQAKYNPIVVHDPKFEGQNPLQEAIEPHVATGQVSADDKGKDEHPSGTSDVEPIQIEATEGSHLGGQDASQEPIMPEQAEDDYASSLSKKEKRKKRRSKARPENEISIDEPNATQKEASESVEPNLEDCESQEVALSQMPSVNDSNEGDVKVISISKGKKKKGKKKQIQSQDTLGNEPDEAQVVRANAEDMEFDNEASALADIAPESLTEPSAAAKADGELVVPLDEGSGAEHIPFVGKPAGPVGQASLHSTPSMTTTDQSQQEEASPFVSDATLDTIPVKSQVAQEFETVPKKGKKKKGKGKGKQSTELEDSSNRHSDDTQEAALLEVGVRSQQSDSTDELISAGNDATIYVSQSTDTDSTPVSRMIEDKTKMKGEQDIDETATKQSEERVDTSQDGQDKESLADKFVSRQTDFQGVPSSSGELPGKTTLESEGLEEALDTKPSPSDSRQGTENPAMDDEATSLIRELTLTKGAGLPTEEDIRPMPALKSSTTTPQSGMGFREDVPSPGPASPSSATAELPTEAANGQDGNGTPATPEEPLVTTGNSEHESMVQHACSPAPSLGESPRVPEREGILLRQQESSAFPELSLDNLNISEPALVDGDSTEEPWNQSKSQRGKKGKKKSRSSVSTAVPEVEDTDNNIHSGLVDHQPPATLMGIDVPVETELDLPAAEVGAVELEDLSMPHSVPEELKPDTGTATPANEDPPHVPTLTGDEADVWSAAKPSKKQTRKEKKKKKKKQKDKLADKGLTIAEDDPVQDVSHAPVESTGDSTITAPVTEFSDDLTAHLSAAVPNADVNEEPTADLSPVLTHVTSENVQSDHDLTSDDMDVNDENYQPQFAARELGMTTQLSTGEVVDDVIQELVESVTVATTDEAKPRQKKKDKKGKRKQSKSWDESFSPCETAGAGYDASSGDDINNPGEKTSLEPNVEEPKPAKSKRKAIKDTLGPRESALWEEDGAFPEKAATELDASEGAEPTLAELEYEEPKSSKARRKAKKDKIKKSLDWSTAACDKPAGVENPETHLPVESISESEALSDCHKIDQDRNIEIGGATEALQKFQNAKSQMTEETGDQDLSQDTKADGNEFQFSKKNTGKRRNAKATDWTDEIPRVQVVTEPADQDPVRSPAAEVSENDVLPVSEVPNENESTSECPKLDIERQSNAQNDNNNTNVADAPRSTIEQASSPILELASEIMLPESTPVSDLESLDGLHPSNLTQCEPNREELDTATDGPRLLPDNALTPEVSHKGEALESSGSPTGHFHVASCVTQPCSENVLRVAPEGTESAHHDATPLGKQVNSVIDDDEPAKAKKDKDARDPHSEDSLPTKLFDALVKPSSATQDISEQSENLSFTVPQSLTRPLSKKEKKAKNKNKKVIESIDITELPGSIRIEVQQENPILESKDEMVKNQFLQPAPKTMQTTSTEETQLDDRSLGNTEADPKFERSESQTGWEADNFLLPTQPSDKDTEMVAEVPITQGVTNAHASQVVISLEDDKCGEPCSDVQAKELELSPFQGESKPDEVSVKTVNSTTTLAHHAESATVEDGIVRDVSSNVFLKPFPDTSPKIAAPLGEISTVLELVGRCEAAGIEKEMSFLESSPPSKTDSKQKKKALKNERESHDETPSDEPESQNLNRDTSSICPAFDNEVDIKEQSLSTDNHLSSEHIGANVTTAATSKDDESLPSIDWGNPEQAMDDEVTTPNVLSSHPQFLGDQAHSLEPLEMECQFLEEGNGDIDEFNADARPIAQIPIDKPFPSSFLGVTDERRVTAQTKSIDTFVTTNLPAELEAQLASQGRSVTPPRDQVEVLPEAGELKGEPGIMAAEGRESRPIDHKTNTKGKKQRKGKQKRKQKTSEVSLKEEEVEAIPAVETRDINFSLPVNVESSLPDPIFMAAKTVNWEKSNIEGSPRMNSVSDGFKQPGYPSDAFAGQENSQEPAGIVASVFPHLKRVSKKTPSGPVSDSSAQASSDRTKSILGDRTQPRQYGNDRDAKHNEDNSRGDDLKKPSTPGPMVLESFRGPEPISRGHDPVDLSVHQPPSLFGGPYGLAEQQRSRSPPKTPLATIREQAPSHSPSHTRHRDILDVGSPERGLKIAKLDRKSSQNLQRPTGDLLKTDARRVSYETPRSSPQPAQFRSFSGPPDNILKTPEHTDAIRPLSVASIESIKSTDSLRLRRSPGSGDLRAQRKRELLGGKNKSPMRQPEAEDDNIMEAVPSSSTYDPVTDKGKLPLRGMAADVYEGWGDVPGSPLSPSRPPSVRRRRSLQHLQELETRLDQMVSENRLLSTAKTTAEKALETQTITHRQHAKALEARERQIQDKDSVIQQLKKTTQWLQKELARLTELNDSLAATNLGLQSSREHENSQHNEVAQRWQQSRQELEELRAKYTQLSTGMEGIVRNQVDTALAEKNAEIHQLRTELLEAQNKIKELQERIVASSRDNVITFHDEDYFESACQKLCHHVQQWVLRFSKFSDMRLCRLTSSLHDEKVADRFENAILDGSDVDSYLADRVKRRDVFMSVVMTMMWDYIFTRYLFGMDREQRQKLKTLEKQLSEVGPPAAVQRWRATTLSLLAKRHTFQEQRVLDTEAVVQEIYRTLSRLLPPPQELEKSILDSLRKVMRAAVELSIEMRTQKAEYIMLPPLRPEYDTNGDLVRKVHFNADLMNERSGETSSNEELEKQQAVVRIVLFPLVVKKGSDEGEGDEEIVVCPAQVLVARPGKDKKVVRVLSGDRLSAHPVSHSIQSSASIEMDPSNMI